MVGGTVVETLLLWDRVYVNCRDDVNGGECAIHVELNRFSRAVRPGDIVWWQGPSALWSPRVNRQIPPDSQVCGVTFDIEIPRIGYSGVNHPAKHLVEGAFAAT